jgi:glycosyltransferase involved in cell wall biosynthesis
MLKALDSSAYKEDIELLGRQTFKKLKVLYSKAEALIYIPHFEGFGIPVLEGFAAGIPVICSNTTSIPEVAGEAALQCAPTDYQAVSEAMHKITSDKTTRNQAIVNGKKRLDLFNWDKTASALWKSLEKTTSS